MSKIERRFFTAEDQAHFRAETNESGDRYIVGYAAVFGRKSKLVFGDRGLFYEIIERKAFDEVLQDPLLDVTLNFQHSDNYLIARSTAGTLEMTTDDYGLLIRAKLPNVSYANDLYELVSRGDLKAMSFAFWANEEDYRWGEYDGDFPIGYLEKVRDLLDVAVVVRPAYEDTRVGARSELATRSYEAYQKAQVTDPEKGDEVSQEVKEKEQKAREYEYKLKMIKIKNNIQK